MSTGYTAGIIDGKINTFQEFAKLCMRAFGANMHMRDESLTTEYFPDTPHDYHKNALENANKQLEEVKNLSDVEIVKMKKEELEENRKNCIKNIEKKKIDKIKLDKMLKKAQSYNPPTSEHEGIKEFMIEQLEITIRSDTDMTFYQKELKKTNNQIKNINAQILRKKIIKRIKEDINYHLEKQKEEIDRCNKNNKWVEIFINSLNN